MRCQACHESTNGDRHAGARGHADSREKAIQLCGRCFMDETVWKPLLWNRYEVLIAKRKAVKS